MIGQILGGQYKIIQKLGYGAFSQTYIAEDTIQFNAKCIVRQLKPLALTPDTLGVAKRLFEKEAQLLYHLGSHHNQIPQLLAYFQENQEFYLVEEFIDGHDLSEELTPGKQLSESYVIALLQSILEPLAFVHQQKVIHQDIKPHNLIRRKCDDKIVLVDFGTVKELAVTQIVNSQGETRVVTIIGTPGYMPSEQGRGKPRFSSDVYAVGIIGIQALTGLTLGQLQEDTETWEIIWRDQVEVSPQLAEVLDKMVRYDFRHRYQSAGEALQAVQQLAHLCDMPTSQATEILTTSLMHELTLEWFEGEQRRVQAILERQPSKNPGTFRIGREPAACDLVLSEPTVSRLHVEIFFNPQQQGFYLRSLRESNPPMVNGQSLPTGEVLLNQGSSLQLGQMELKVTAIALKQYFVEAAPSQPAVHPTPAPQQPVALTQAPPQPSTLQESQHSPPPVSPQYRQELIEHPSIPPSAPQRSRLHLAFLIICRVFAASLIVYGAKGLYDYIACLIALGSCDISEPGAFWKFLLCFIVGAFIWLSTN